MQQLKDNFPPKRGILYIYYIFKSLNLILELIPSVEPVLLPCFEDSVLSYFRQKTSALVWITAFVSALCRCYGTVVDGGCCNLSTLCARGADVAQLFPHGRMRNGALVLKPNFGGLFRGCSCFHRSFGATNKRFYHQRTTHWDVFCFLFFSFCFIFMWCYVYVVHALAPPLPNYCAMFEFRCRWSDLFYWCAWIQNTDIWRSNFFFKFCFNNA